ncbi:MAG TPA: 2-oxoacid:ferredoxin oxidoreductase subunit beta [Clostridia bacterium]|nr:2-oxoacid:ferredoxin oxidoreductase subunit beta [Clostridia bacterium]
MSNETFCTYETAWCPGCGNFVILECLKTALEQLGKAPYEVLVAAGIGQAAKTPQYIGANAFCGLHGRSLPAAIAAKIANESLTVVVDTGDGDSYGEGGNHFLHNIRRNVDITHFVHDNQIYGLTKGQASPTSGFGMVTGVQTDGNINEPLNPVLLAIASGAGFVARGFTGHKEQLIALMKEAISYKGYALVDILQPCVSFNKTNTFGWYKERVYDLDASYDAGNKATALIKSMEFDEKIPLGILYREEKCTYHQKNEVLQQGIPLLDRNTEKEVLQKHIASYI